MTETKSKSDAYNNVVEHASLENILLTSSVFDLRHDFYDEEESIDRFIDQATSAPHFDEQSRFLMGSVQCRVWMNKQADNISERRLPEEAFADSILSVTATYSLIFAVPGEHDSETLSTFFRRMAPFSVWPYFRVHVAQVAAESGIKIPILPIKKLFHPVKKAGGYVDRDEREEVIQATSDERSADDMAHQKD